MTDPEFGPFLSSQRHAAEQRARREHLLRMELAPPGVIDSEFRQIAEDFHVAPRPSILARGLRSVVQGLGELLYWTIPKG